MANERPRHERPRHERPRMLDIDIDERITALERGLSTITGQFNEFCQRIEPPTGVERAPDPPRERIKNILRSELDWPNWPEGLPRATVGEPELDAIADALLAARETDGYEGIANRLVRELTAARERIAEMKALRAFAKKHHDIMGLHVCMVRDKSGVAHWRDALCRLLAPTADRSGS